MNRGREGEEKTDKHSKRGEGKRGEGRGGEERRGEERRRDEKRRDDKRRKVGEKKRKEKKRKEKKERKERERTSRQTDRQTDRRQQLLILVARSTHLGVVCDFCIDPNISTWDHEISINHGRVLHHIIPRHAEFWGEFVLHQVCEPFSILVIH